MTTRAPTTSWPSLPHTLLSILAALFLWVGCSSTPSVPANEAEEGFNRAAQLEKDERYEEAIEKYAEVKNRFPYSKFAVSAELKIADLHYKKEAYIEAQNSYQLFKELHPRHPEIAYVTFRLGLSHYYQLPSTIDRDLTPALKAIQYFDEVARNYPQSTYVAEALEKKLDCRKQLAEKEMYIAEFYFKRDMFDSALRRYENLATNYADTAVVPKALLGAGRSAIESGEREKAKLLLGRLVANFPQSDEAERARGEIDKHGLR